MTGRVIVVGSVNIDLVVTAPRLPGAGETVTGGQFGQFDGGKGGNQAVASARLGVPTIFVGAVGDDEFGRQARVALEAEGIDVAELLTTPSAATGVALIVVEPGGENLIAVASGANMGLDSSAVRAALERLAPAAGDVVLTGTEIPTAGAREALRIGRARGATTILNPAPATGIDRSTFGLADVLTPNRGELRAIVSAEAERLGRSDGRPDDLVRRTRSLVERNAEGAGAGAVLVTLGPDGALVVGRHGEPVEIRAPAVEAVDSTGAGDALNGALAAGLAQGLELHAAARRAVRAASLSTTRRGARSGLPTSAEMEAATTAAP